MPILVVGFPYVRQSYFETFNHYPGNNELFFLLPKVWSIKNGKVVFRPPKEKNIFTTKTFFHHSLYPIIGGSLKGWMPFFPFLLRRLKKEKEINLVYACSEPNLLSTFYFNFWSKLLGLKCVNFTWENVPYWNKFHGFEWLIRKFIIRINLALSDGIICGNTRGKEIFKKLTQKPIAIIPMSGVDPKIFQRKGEEKKFDGHDWRSKIVFTFTGAIGYRKGVHLIIEAFKRVAAEIPSAHLVIAGSGEYEKEIENLIQNSGIADRITRIPWIDHAKLPQLFEASDVFLYPSISYGGWEEQFGYAMAEASLMELPVIATKSGSIPDVVLDGKTGILIPENDPEALSEAMLRLSADSKLREKMGRDGRQYIFENFRNPVVARKFADFFQSV